MDYMYYDINPSTIQPQSMKITRIITLILHLYSSSMVEF